MAAQIGVRRIGRDGAGLIDPSLPGAECWGDKFYFSSKGRVLDGPVPPQNELVWWDGQKWVGDVPDTRPDAPPGTYGAFIMLPEGVGRLYAPTLNDGPFPEHYEAIESPVDNPLHPRVSSNPVSGEGSSCTSRRSDWRAEIRTCTSRGT